ncbi:MAG TPA: hypothetical protein VHP83_03830 [Aggregatilineaceae bacterium]|nr:hypothetical protein [Aggregatilineaceae bacterium]
MAYELKWYSSGEVLRVDMRDTVSLDELKAVNQEVMNILNASDRRLILLLDVSSLKAGYATVENLGMTQHYRDHGKLEAIIAVANNKLNRLVTMLAFHLSRARFVQFDNLEQAQPYLSMLRLIRNSDSGHQTQEPKQV